MKTVLFGLDGATYTVLDHLVALGVMPTLAQFLRQGTRAVLHSTPTVLTPQAWTSLATGRGAGHHGITDFIRIEQTPQAVYFRINDSRDNHCDPVWRIASRHGKRVTVLNYFGTAPPEPVNGHIVPGWISPRHLRRLSHPADLFTRLQALPDFDVKVLGVKEDFEREGLRDMPAGRWCPWIQGHIDRERAWFAVMDHLMATEPSDLTAIVFDGVDKIQHLAYRYLDPALVPANPSAWEQEVIALCRVYFKQVDDFLARVLARVGRWGRVFIASDHGFTATHEILYVNKWLHDQGWLRWRGEMEEDQKHACFHEDATQFAGSIDLPNTKAYAVLPSCNGLYLNVPAGEYAAFREELIRRLYALRGPDGGQIVTDIKKREEWFAGPFMDRAPDLTLTLRDHGSISVLNAHDVVVPRPHPMGTHHPLGVLLGTGPGIREGVAVEQHDIRDVAPLLLHSLGLEIPGEMEGKFPAAFYDPAYLDSDPPRVRRTEAPAGTPVTPTPAEHEEMDAAEQVVILERLRSLGYIE